MKKIILMRHGEPKLNLDLLKQQRFSSKELGQLIKQYETSPLKPNNKPPIDATNIANTADHFFCSDLVRAIESTQRLAGDKKIIQNPCFRESDLPYFDGQHLKLSFMNWAIILRVLWFLGFSNNGEPIKQAKVRAKTSAAELVASTALHNTVLLLGHGIMNRLIAKELKSQGWQLSNKTGISYWSFMVFEKQIQS